MKLLMCSIFDSKVGTYSFPFAAKTQGEAIRSFTDACADDSLPFKRHPADYRLYHIAVFDDADGSIQSHNPVPLLGADEL
jgi:hypothetical protein